MQLFANPVRLFTLTLHLPRISADDNGIMAKYSKKDV